MPGRLIVITGTDTDIGKTHLACALLLHAKTAGRVAFGYKPIETGVGPGSITDAERLAMASASVPFHVKRAPAVQLRLALSPHLAAASEGVAVPWPAIRDWIAAARAEVDLLVEFAGGLFTPLVSTLLTVDAVAELNPDVTVLVAPDRLGALHHVGSALAGAQHHNVHIHAVAIITPPQTDASTDTNAYELRQLTTIPVLGPWPRSSPAELVAHPATVTLARLWLKL